MTREIDLFGVFMPDLLVSAVAAYLLAMPLRAMLSTLGVYRIVWHRALFDTALYVLVLAATVAASHVILT